jgi:S1-C subfamily serine protease
MSPPHPCRAPSRPRALAFAAALVVALVAAPPLLAFEAQVLDSVVSVLPEWADRAAHAERPEGTAVAVLPGGYLATNLHVVARSLAITIRRRDGRLRPARLVGRDPLTDIALLKIEDALPVLLQGPEPELGAKVCIVSNQFGLDLSVTCGVVSGLRRSGTGFNPIEDFIQTDAVANPGSSGGALVDAEGRLVGLVSAIFTKESDANIGVNFAASMALVMRVVEDLAADGRVTPARLGVRVENLDQAVRASLVGARVSRVEPGAAAHGAGLAVGDVITAIAGRAVAKASDLVAAVYLHRAGERLPLTLQRGDQRLEITVELGR